MATTATTDLERRCDVLRSLHRPGAPLLLPNAWDVATARAVVAAGFPVVATTSGGVAGTLGYDDHEGGPGDEMLAAAARIVRVLVPGRKRSWCRKPCAAHTPTSRPAWTASTRSCCGKRVRCGA